MDSCFRRNDNLGIDNNFTSPQSSLHLWERARERGKFGFRVWNLFRVSIFGFSIFLTLAT